MANGYLVAAAAGLTLALVGLLYALAARDAERYRAQILGPALVTSLAAFLASLVWWCGAHTAHRALKLYIYEAGSAENLAQVTDPALMLAIASGLIGLFSWWLPDLLERRRCIERGDLSAR